MPSPRKVDFSPTALLDLEDIADYIAKRTSVVAKRSTHGWRFAPIVAVFKRLEASRLGKPTRAARTGASGRRDAPPHGRVLKARVRGAYDLEHDELSNVQRANP